MLVSGVHLYIQEGQELAGITSAEELEERVLLRGMLESCEPGDINNDFTL